MDIHPADVTLHIDQELSEEQLTDLETDFRQRDGIVSVHFNPAKTHLLLVKYNPKLVNSKDLLDILRYRGLHGELVGL